MGKIEVGARVKWDEHSKSRPVKAEVVRDRDRERRSEPLPPSSPAARGERKKMQRRSPRRAERRTRSPSRNSRDSQETTDVVLRLSRDDAKHLKDRAQAWHERQLRVVGARIKALKKELGYSDVDGKSKTRCVAMARNKKRKDERQLEKTERDERQLDSWRAARDALNELEPSENLREALEVLYLGPLINTMQHLDGINNIQTELADLQGQVDAMKRQLRKAEGDISQSRKELEEKDDWLRKRMWKCFYYNRQFLCGFEDS